MSFSMFSMLGGRASVIDYHMKSIRDNISGDVRKYFLLPDKEKKKTFEVVSKYSDLGVFIERNENNFNKIYPDFSYDYMLRNYCETKKFLLVHDDTIIKRNNFQKIVRESMGKYDFGGQIDNACKNKSQYEKIILDGQKLSDIRIGTWCLYGDYKKYIENNYWFGKGGYEYQYIINWKYKTRRIKLNKYRVWLDGGFNFNIKSRLDNNNIKVERDESLIEHYTRCTNFFASRGMLEFVDQENEADEWIYRIKELKKNKEVEQIKKDLVGLENLNKIFSINKIKDELINDNFISELKKHA